MKKILIAILLLVSLSACDSTLLNNCGEYGECVREEETATEFAQTIEDLKEVVKINCLQGLTSTGPNGIERYDLVEDEQGICLILYLNESDDYKLYSFGNQENTKLLDVDLNFWIEDVQQAMLPFVELDTFSLIIDTEYSDEILLSYGDFYFTIFANELEVCESPDIETCESSRGFGANLIRNVDFDESLFSATLEEIMNDLEVLSEKYGNQYYVYKGTTEDVNIYRKSNANVEIMACTDDMVSPTSLGDGLFLPGGGSGSCHQSVFAVKGEEAYRLSGNVSDSTIGDVGLTASEICEINAICTSSFMTPIAVVTEEQIDRDLELLNPTLSSIRSYVFLGLVNGYRIYHSNLDMSQITACTMDMVASKDLGDGYYTMPGSSGSCYNTTFAVRRDVIYSLSGNGETYTPDELGFSPKEFCSLGVCFNTND